MNWGPRIPGNRHIFRKIDTSRIAILPKKKFFGSLEGEFTRTIHSGSRDYKRIEFP
jgi:hypothetical protein